MKEDAVIFDLDGTLAEIEHRVKFVRKDPKDWKSFYMGIPDDNVNEWCKDLLNAMKETNHKVIIVTGRDKKHSEMSEKWLLENSIHFDEVYYRDHGDRRADSFVKEEIYNQFIKDRFNVKFVVDDRLQVVKMWRSLGLVCLQCDWGDF